MDTAIWIKVQELQISTLGLPSPGRICVLNQAMFTDLRG